MSVIRYPDQRGSISIPKSMIQKLHPERIYVYQDSNSLLLTTPRTGNSCKTSYTVDSHGNVRVTKKTLSLIGLSDSYEISEENSGIKIRAKVIGSSTKSNKPSSAKPAKKQTSTDLVDVIILVDRSGSMSSIQVDMENGLNNFIKEQQAEPGNVRLSLYSFDSYGVDEHCVDVAIKDAPRFKLVPRASTPLYYSMMNVIDRTLKRHSKTVPNKVIYVVITDGQENTNRGVSRADIDAKIAELRDKKLWNIVFMGCRFNASEYGQDMGIKQYSTMTFKDNKRGIDNAFESLSKSVTNIKGMSAQDYVETVTSGFFFEENDYKSQK